MPKKSSVSTKTKSKSPSRDFIGQYKAYPCRLCKRPHPLRTCRKFLAMNMSDRIRAVRDNKYCVNCLAHDHSHGTCFSKRGCKHCQKFHHTLLHVHPRLEKDLLPESSKSRSRSRSSSPVPSSSKKQKVSFSSKPQTIPKSVSSSVSLSKILNQNIIILLPTVLVKIDSTTSHARCLLDTGSAFSRVSKSLVDKLNLTGYTLREETICPIVLKSRYDSSSKLEGTFRVDNRIALRTPSQSLPETFKKNFKDLFLADSEFFKSSSIDVVIGADLYSKAICEGLFSRVGLPTAQSTIFGWTIYGPCSL